MSVSPVVTIEQIVDGIRALGLKQGDVVILHSSLSSLGQVEGGEQTVVDAFLKVLGEKGTLVVPTFGYLGQVPEVVKRHPRMVQGLHPRASLAAIGARAEELLRDHWKAPTAHAEDTPYMRLAEQGGYVCLLGVDQDRNTMLHTAEALLRLPYLKRTAEATFQTPEGEVTKSWSCFPGPHRDFIGLDRIFRESGKMRTGRIGNSVVRLIKAKDLVDLAMEAGRRDPAFVLCDNPNCPDCTQQRAANRRHRLSAESFTLSASAALAGRYVPEIAEQTRLAGLSAVELDYVEGRPIATVPVVRLQSWITGLREAGCEVAALRSGVISAKNAELIKQAAEARVKRVVLPLAHDADERCADAAQLGVDISFFNAGIDSDVASQMLLDLRESGHQAGFTFNAANFARAGENPFLGSYKKKLRRFVDQLDIEDALYGSAPTALAMGNAEIKEMISILRCASFSGPMVLTAANRAVGSLLDVVRRFEDLLDHM